MIHCSLIILNYSPLITAVKYGDVAIVSLLLDHGADVNLLDVSYKTPLHFSSMYSTPHIAQMLISAGVEIDRQDEAGLTALHCAVSKGCEEQVRLLVDRGANILLKTKVRETALYRLFREPIDWNYGICKLLLEKGANCNDDNWEESPFLNALRNGSLKFIKLMLSYGADISIMSPQGLIASHFAAENPHTDVIEFILDHGLDIDSRMNQESFTPLHIAAKCGNFGGCEILLKRGATINAISRSGTSPLHEAIASSQLQSARVLLDHGAYEANEISNRLSILEFARDSREVKMSNFLTSHVAKVMYLNLHVNEGDRRVIENENFYHDYYQKCLQEIKSMKKLKVYQNVSVFNLFTESDKGITVYARNSELIKTLEVKDYENKCPIYADSIRRRFYGEVEKQKIWHAVGRVVCDIFNFNDPYHLIVQKILSYLDAEDLAKLQYYSSFC